MSSWVLAWAWSQRGLSDGAHLLLCYMADQADDDGIVGLYRSVSRAALAGMFDVSVDTIDRRVRELQTESLVVVEKRQRPGPEGGSVSITNVYRLQSPEPPSAQGRNSAAVDDGDDFSQGRDDAATPPPGPQITGEVVSFAATVAASDAGDGRELRPPQPHSSAATVAAPVAAHKDSPPLPPPGGVASDLLPVGDPSIPRHTLSKHADWVVHYADDSLLDPTKFAALVSGAFEVSKWVQSGAHIEHVVLAVVKGELIKRRQQGKGPITSWGLLRNDVRAAAARFLTPLEDFAAQAMESANVESANGAQGASAGRVAAGAGRAGSGEPSGMLGAAVRRANGRRGG